MEKDRRSKSSMFDKKDKGSNLKSKREGQGSKKDKPRANGISVSTSIPPNTKQDETPKNVAAPSSKTWASLLAPPTSTPPTTAPVGTLHSLGTTSSVKAGGSPRQHTPPSEEHPTSPLLPASVAPVATMHPVPIPFQYPQTIPFVHGTVSSPPGGTPFHPPHFPMMHPGGMHPTPMPWIPMPPLPHMMAPGFQYQQFHWNGAMIPPGTVGPWPPQRPPVITAMAPPFPSAPPPQPEPTRMVIHPVEHVKPTAELPEAEQSDIEEEGRTEKQECAAGVDPPSQQPHLTWAARAAAAAAIAHPVPHTKAQAKAQTTQQLKAHQKIKGSRGMGQKYHPMKDSMPQKDHSSPPTLDSKNAEIEGATVVAVSLEEHGIRFLPKGLSNPGNLCFMNSVLQALLGSPVFCSFFASLKTILPSLDVHRTPVLFALAHLANEFPRADGSHNSSIPTKQPGPSSSEEKTAGRRHRHHHHHLLGGRTAVDPAMLYAIVNCFKPGNSSFAAVIRGDEEPHAVHDQEDAQEFYEWLVESMHQELLVLEGVRPPPAISDYDNDERKRQDEWLTKSGKRSVKKQETGTSEPITLVSQLFRGRWASTISCSGSSPSVTITPFTTIQLDILDERIKSIDDALLAATAVEDVEDYRPAPSSAPQKASKTVRLAEVPPVLVLHVCRFHWSKESSKLNRAIEFGGTLVIKSSWLDPACRDRGTHYDLIGTVSHHGKNLTNGHYTADVLQADGKWLRFDDAEIYSVSLQSVLTERPYILFYQRR